MENGRFLVVTYWRREGFDNDERFEKRADAVRECRLLEQHTGADAAAIYDTKRNRVTVIYGGERAFIKKEFGKGLGAKIETDHGLFDADHGRYVNRQRYATRA